MNCEIKEGQNTIFEEIEIYDENNPFITKNNNEVEKSISSYDTNIKSLSDSLNSCN